jgi:hypothetical protein
MAAKKFSYSRFLTNLLAVANKKTRTPCKLQADMAAICIIANCKLNLKAIRPGFIHLVEIKIEN